MDVDEVGKMCDLYSHYHHRTPPSPPPQEKKSKRKIYNEKKTITDCVQIEYKENT